MEGNGQFENDVRYATPNYATCWLIVVIIILICTHMTVIAGIVLDVVSVLSYVVLILRKFRIVFIRSVISDRTDAFISFVFS